MPLSPGTRLGPYEILSPIGAGGMGEVYRAKDTRLDRAVAVKVLPSHVSKKPELRERFEREARAVSSLNHPNICTLHDVGRQEGVDFLVMELIEGESLAARLEKGALPSEPALRIAAEIASALDRAHRSGIVHRDLKPGNIMLTKSGAKLLDFGLAKLRAGENPAADGISSLRTENRDLTGEGAILGTFQYMSPEQLEGKEADARSDIFAFGAVLYEMVTGRRAFTGKSQASLIASILAAEPQPITSIQPMAPPALDRVVRACLAKDPDERWQTAHDVMLQLRWIAEGGSSAGIAAPVAARRRSREKIAWIAAAAFLTTTILMTLAWVRRAPPPPETARLQILPPEKTTFNTQDGPVTLSPDGRRMVFVATGAEEKDSLWVRDLGAVGARRIDGADDVYDPFWSADSRFVGFGGGGLSKVDVSGGPVQKICEMLDGRGGTWNKDNVILFARSGASPIFRVSAGGGNPEAVTVLDASRHETGHWRPHFLPDGEHFLFLVKSSEPQSEGIFLGSLASKERSRLLDLNVAMTPAPPGHLLYVRDRILMAQPFDFGRLRTTRDPFPVAKDLEYVQTWGASSFSVSENGTLALQSPSRRNRQLVWIDRAGRQLGVVGPAEEYRGDPRLSPDGRQAAVERLDPETRGRDIWLIDLARGIGSRLTSDPGVDEAPVWSPDGSRIAFTSNRAGIQDIYLKPANGTGSEEPLVRSDVMKFPNDWSPDGRLLVFTVDDPKTHGDLWLLPLTGERKPEPLMSSPFNEGNGRFSPDGKWLAYTSDESGREEVFVQPFPLTGAKWQVSTDGGRSIDWSGGGREILYVQPGGARMSVPITTSPSFEAGVPKELFRNSLLRGGGITADGQRYLATLPQGDSAASPITVVLNWTAELKP